MLYYFSVIYHSMLYHFSIIMYKVIHMKGTDAIAEKTVIPPIGP